jgi:hypothetical protein
MRALAEKGNTCIALHQLQSHDAIAAITPSPNADEETIATVKGNQRCKKTQRQQRSSSPFDKKKLPLCCLHYKVC